MILWGLNICYWIEVKSAGLGQHTIAFGGLVDQVQVNNFYRVSQAYWLFALYFDSLYLDPSCKTVSLRLF